jgi:L-alanine-DL-glutamate epimerase-like enolase superfamily enzyme
MKIAQVAGRLIQVQLTRPYTISGHHWDSVQFVLFSVQGDDGLFGYGVASPAPEVTGETCAAALRELKPSASAWLIGRAPSDPELQSEIKRRCTGPAARAAIDMALCDVIARAAGVPFVEQLGRVHEVLPTSITIGQMSIAETMTAAEEYNSRGFSVWKVKTGCDVDEDLARLRALRGRYGARITLLADANQGYDERALLRFVAGMGELDLAMLEQPMPPGSEGFLCTLPSEVQRRLAADESVCEVADLERMLAAGCPYGIVNIKLMKCGGPRAALQLARVCEQNGLDVMWGCNDESVLGIAAALHVAFASKATRHLDLDGSFDLATDPFTGGFAIAAGNLRTLLLPGFGASPA